MDYPGFSSDTSKHNVYYFFADLAGFIAAQILDPAMMLGGLTLKAIAGLVGSTLGMCTGMTKVTKNPQRLAVFVCEVKRRPVNAQDFRQLNIYLNTERLWQIVEEIGRKQGVTHPTGRNVVGVMIAPKFVGDMSGLSRERLYAEDKKYRLDILELKNYNVMTDKNGKTVRTITVHGLKRLDVHAGFPQREKNAMTVPIERAREG